MKKIFIIRGITGIMVMIGVALHGEAGLAVAALLALTYFMYPKDKSKLQELKPVFYKCTHISMQILLLLMIAAYAIQHNYAIPEVISKYWFYFGVSLFLIINGIVGIVLFWKEKD
jgi:hypothetical protein